MSEHDEQVSYFATLKLNERYYPWLRFAYAVPNGGHRHVAVAARLKSEGVKAGVADIFLPFPMKLWHGAYIEMKFGKNRLTTEQAEFAGFITTQNYAFKMAHSCDEALEFTEAYLGIELVR